MTELKFWVEEEDKYKGFTYRAMACIGGWRCGYVRIPSNHYLYKKTYRDNLRKILKNVLEEEQVGKRGILSLCCFDGKTITMDILFDVHGSITFSGKLKDTKGWWIGFDCNHSGDAQDVSIMNDYYKDGVKKAIEQAGYVPVRVDLQDFNEKICDEIIAEIRRTKFVVADFSGMRSGVFFESGFAKGLGREVIFTVRKENVDQLKEHFDTRQYNYIVYDSPEDLRKKLYNRICATIV